MVFWPWNTRNTPENIETRQYNTVTSSDANQKQHTISELPTLENKNATQPSDPEETLTQEQQTNVENVKRIMNSEKTNLPSLRNIEWRTL